MLWVSSVDNVPQVSHIKHSIIQKITINPHLLLVVCDFLFISVMLSVVNHYVFQKRFCCFIAQSPTGMRSPVLTRVLSPQELSVHAQAVMQSALIKQQLHDQNMRYQKKQLER